MVRVLLYALRFFPPTFGRNAIFSCVHAGAGRFAPAQLAPYLTPPTSLAGLLPRFLTLLVHSTALLLRPCAAVPRRRRGRAGSVRRPVPRLPTPAGSKSSGPAARRSARGIPVPPTV